MVRGYSNKARAAILRRKLRRQRGRPTSNPLPLVLAVQTIDWTHDWVQTSRLWL